MNRLGISRLIAIVFGVLVLMKARCRSNKRGTLTEVITDPTGAAVVTRRTVDNHAFGHELKERQR